MRIAKLLVERAGPLTTVQDAGRVGWARYGVPRSGPIDRLSFDAAHAALGNSPGGAALEVAAGGLVLRCVEGEVGFALTGAAAVAVSEDSAGGAWQCGAIRPGMRLSIRGAVGGNWGYLAFAGRLKADAWLGSVATHALSGLGGGHVRPGQELTVETAALEDEGRHLPRPVSAPSSFQARVVLGPQDRFFSREAIERLLGKSFGVTMAMDRMGMVVLGPDLTPERVDMPSEPAVRGSLQVDGSGRVTVLLSDHQTTGGYPKIATVIAPDVDALAQLSPGTAFRLVEVSPEAAVRIAREDHTRRERYLAGLRRADALAERLASFNLISGMVSGTDEDVVASGGGQTVTV